MKRFVNRMLRKLGFEIRRLPARPALPVSLNDKEVVELEDVLARFAARQPSGSDLADIRALRSYLSDDRVHFFHEVLKRAEESGVSLSKRRIADVGCGTGYLLYLIANATDSAELIGFDTFAEMNELARMFCPSATIHDLPLQAIDDTFDVIFCTEVLEHLTDPVATLRKLFRCLSSSGALILTVPDGRRDQQSAGQIRADGSAYWGHINFWSPENWSRFLRMSLEEPVDVRTCVLDSGKNFAAISRRGFGGLADNDLHSSRNVDC
jgi:2-polyprenyl-3-methyl-5-hydroxy-6-metoxy-1,4-benzoquinol methylase